ncbi:MAG: lipocalin family protein [Flavobacteriaceae bacterium]|nr:lipocalin family protein [Flavobacteriaceae bacterium]
MKKLIYLALIILLISCVPTKSESGSNTSSLGKETLKGTWEVTNIKFIGDQNLSKTSLFDLADSQCFKGSKWVFTPVDGSGKITLDSSARCKASVNRIYWSFFEPGNGSYQLQFKHVDKKNKALDTANRGYQSTVNSLSENSMEMRVTTTHNGNLFDIVMRFTKISELTF